MSSENNQGNILSSWKEIAAYLKCGVRTCMRYEGKYGLPVYRLEEKPKTHVFAYKNELDEWLTKRANRKENNQSEIKFQPKWRKVYYLIFAAIVICVSILLLNSFLLKNDIPSNFHIEGSKLIIVDNKNNNLWEYDTGIDNLAEEKVYREHFQYRRKRTGSSANHLPYLIIKDINNDGNNEVLFSTHTQDEFGEGELFCFNHKGDPMWNFAAGRELKFGPKVYSPDYRIHGIDICDFDSDGNSEIILVSWHRYFFPSQLVILSSGGKIFGEYWNVGYFSDLNFEDLDGDEKKDLIVTGVNNEYGKGCLIIFNMAKVEGGSPQNEFYNCKEIKSGTEKYYLIFPRTDVDLLEHIQEGILRVDVLKNQRISVRTALSSIFFELNNNLELQDIRYSYTFTEKHKKALLEGKIRSVLDEKYRIDLAQRLLYWDGQNWASTPTMNSYWKNKALNH